MAEVATRRPGRPARLSRDQVLRAALALADEGGLEALTMQRIGEQVEAEAMSLYRHVRNKDDVLDGIVDLVFEEIELAPAGTDWKIAMRDRAISARAVLLRHPWALGLMESRMQPGPANLGHHDAVLGILFAAGFSGRDAVHVYNLLDSYIYGFALQEHALPFTSHEELAEVGMVVFEGVPDGLFRNLRTFTEEAIATGFDYGDEFEFGLDLILDALDRRLVAGQ
jgi:AcrR family transcriptional regulator